MEISAPISIIFLNEETSVRCGKEKAVRSYRFYEDEEGHRFLGVTYKNECTRTLYSLHYLANGFDINGKKVASYDITSRSMCLKPGHQFIEEQFQAIDKRIDSFEFVVISAEYDGYSYNGSDFLPTDKIGKNHKSTAVIVGITLLVATTLVLFLCCFMSLVFNTILYQF